MYPQVTAGRVLRGSIENTYPAQVLNKWLLALGEFDTLNPHQAAERWRMPLKNTLERLHAMVGGPLEIVPGCVEVYRKNVWINPNTPPLQPGKETWEKTRADRLNLIPKEGATVRALADLWQISHISAKRVVERFRDAGLIQHIKVGTKHLWRRAEKWTPKK